MVEDVAGICGADRGSTVRCQDLALREAAARAGVPCLTLGAACEAELATWQAEEAAAYRARPLSVLRS